MSIRLAQVRTFSLTLLAAFFIAALTGCASGVVTQDEAVGTYQADTDWGKSTLTLTSDHLYTQTIHHNTGADLHMAGQWRIEQHISGETHYTTINFTPYYQVTHDKQGVYSLSSAFSIYHVPFGGININADSDYGIAHRKLSHSPAPPTTSSLAPKP